MRTIEQVAREPEPGDEAVLVAGQVIYRVKEVTFSPNPATGGRMVTIRGQREETLREPPYTKTQDVGCLLPMWTDLILRAAATVRTADAGGAAGNGGAVFLEGGRQETD